MTFSAVAAAALALGCGVSQQKYDAALADAEREKAAMTRCSAEAEKARAELARSGATTNEGERAVTEARRDAQYLQTRLDGATAETSELRKELEKLGKNADALLAERGTLSGALTDAKVRLEELRRAQAAAEARALLFRTLALKFQKMIDAGQLSVALRDGRMVIRLPNDVLFDSGETLIKPIGKGTLTMLAAFLRALSDRHYQVAGNTDDVPIHTARFPSNWELSTARAVEVVRFLIAQGVHPETLSASGYGEFDPILPNDSDAGRAKNRRIEIVLQPNIDELVAVPEGR